jgi:hypothetical protein
MGVENNPGEVAPPAPGPRGHCWPAAADAVVAGHDVVTPVPRGALEAGGEAEPLAPETLRPKLLDGVYG